MTDPTTMDVYGVEHPFRVVQIAGEAGSFTVRVNRTPHDRYPDLYPHEFEIAIGLDDMSQLDQVVIVTPDGATHRVGDEI